jgi:hypothetical protein
VPFLIVKSDWKKTDNPQTPTISPKTSNKNFQIAILFKVVEKTRNYAFEDDTAISTRVVSYALGTYKVL